MGDRAGGLTSFGIGLTRLRAIAKRVGRDRDLAVKLWKEPNHDAKIIGLLIDDPKQLTSNRPDSLQRRGQEVRADGRAQAPDQRLLA
jgi:3-methyladenine DNA glycosylase AlkD